MTAGLFAAGYALWCGVWWRLRGGAIGNFGLGGGTKPGTYWHDLSGRAQAGAADAVRQGIAAELAGRRQT